MSAAYVWRQKVIQGLKACILPTRAVVLRQGRRQTVRMSQLDDVAADVREAFERVHREQFLGDRAANPQLTVDVTDAALVDDTPTVVLITPWTVNGLAFPPDDRFPEVLDLAGRRRPVFRVEMAKLGVFRSVNLPLEAASLRSMDQARTLAHSWAGHFRDAVQAARQAETAI